MENDDQQRGRVFTRRELFALLGAAGVLALTKSLAANTRVPATLLGAAVPAADLAGTCIVRPAQTEGPYFVDELLNRSDIRSDPSNGSVRPGTPLQLVFNVSNLAGAACAPLAGVLVDVWHCDAAGAYSDVQAAVGTKFLRGYQVTDVNGVAQFTTVYPGWYQGRTVHVHFKIRSAPSTTPGFEFTSQLYFDDTLTDQVYTAAPYASRGARGTRNANDGIYAAGGSQLQLTATPAATGYTATFDIALDNVVSVRQETWTGVKRNHR